jgi:hypothetical protein
MSKKIELTKEQTEECLRMYNEELLGSTTISERMGFNKKTILRTLKENGVVVGPSGRRSTGGKSSANERYYTKNKETISNWYKAWSKDNKALLRNKHAEWRDANREHVNKYSREYQKKRCATDPKYRLATRTRTAVYTCLKEANVVKYQSTFKLLGYTIEELMLHLENQFTNGMTWDNYGEWHVDHIVPMSSFSFETIECENFKKCWSLKNLQPLWAEDNLSKGSTYL